MKSQTIQPPFTRFTSPNTITSYSPECLGGDIAGQTSLITGTVNWSANLLCFVPLILKEPFLLSQFFWSQGGAANGSADVGIYNEAGTTKIISTGSQTCVGTNVIQVFNVTDTWLPANKRMWLAIGNDGTNRFLINGVSGLAAQGLTYIGVKQQASGWSSGLPSSITFNNPTQVLVPVWGFTRGVI